MCRGGPAQWVVTRYSEVAGLLRDRRLGQFQFADAYRVFPDSPDADSIRHAPASTFINRVVAARDQPEHTRLRRLLGQAFTPRLIAELRQRIAGLVDAFLEPAMERGEVEAVEDLAFPIPLVVLSELLGIPEPEREAIGRRLVTLTKIFAPSVRTRDRVAADESVEWLRRYVGELLSERRARPHNDLLSSLVTAGESGAWTHEELVDNAIFILFAGMETSLNLLASGCALLSEQPGELARLRQNPALVASAVEEFLRFDTPTQLTGRITLEPVSIDGHLVKKDRIVLLLLASANRDERKFEHPDRLLLGRDPNPHLSFGGGAHYCLGAVLARLEAGLFFERLVCRCRVLEPAGPVRREESATLRLYRSVPLHLR